MRYDQSQDAHKQSNYDEWKKTAHIITDVEINLASTGIKMIDVMLMADCMVNDKPFTLYGETGFIVVIPEHNSIKQDVMLLKYPGRKQLVNAIKLLLFNFNKVFVPPAELPQTKSNARVRKKIRGR